MNLVVRGLVQTHQYALLVHYATSTDTQNIQEAPENMFDSIIASGAPAMRKSKGDELDHYLRAELEDHVTDPMAWWHKHRQVYPRLSRMALDYLSIPRTCPFLRSTARTLMAL